MLLDHEILFSYIRNNQNGLKSLESDLFEHFKKEQVLLSMSSVSLINKSVKSEYPALIDDLFVFYNRLTLISPPNWIDWNNKLVKQDFDAYLLGLAADSVDACILTERKSVFMYSDRAVSLDTLRATVREQEPLFPFLDLKQQYLSINQDIDHAINSVIGTSSFIGGKSLKNFEDNFARYLDADYCVGVGNGTDAIEIALEALNLPPGSEVIVPANTFIATSEAVTRCGLRVVFCDCDEHNYTIDIKDAKKRISGKTRAIVAVHLYGHPADVDSLKEIADEQGIKIIEDCAQAHGAEYKGQKVGALCDLGTFSFYPGKNLGAYGDGGAIVTNNTELAEKCRMIANHGRISKYDHQFEGRNSRLDTLQAAILNVKLQYLEKWTTQRIAIADTYLEQLSDCRDIVLPKREEWARQVYHLFVIRAKQRDELRKYLDNHNIQTGIHYPIALPKLEAYTYVNQQNDRMFANTMDNELLSLPIGEHLSVNDAVLISERIKEFFCNG